MEVFERLLRADRKSYHELSCIHWVSWCFIRDAKASPYRSSSLTADRDEPIGHSVHTIGGWRDMPTPYWKEPMVLITLFLVTEIAQMGDVADAPRRMNSVWQ
jgi:hypothetical protein